MTQDEFLRNPRTDAFPPESCGYQSQVDQRVAIENGYSTRVQSNPNEPMCAIRCGSDWPRSAVRFGRAAAPAWPSSSECTPLSIPIETPTQGRGECSRMTEAWPNSSVSVSRIDPADGLNAPLAFAVIAAPRASELSQPPQSAFCLSTWEGARERERERECEKELLA